MWNGALGSRAASAAASVVRKVLGCDDAAVGHRMEVGEVDHRPHPAESGGDFENVLEASQLAHSPHHLDPERDRSVLGEKPVAQLAELLADVVECRLPCAAEEVAGMEHNELGPGCLGDAGGVVEHTHRALVLRPSIDVAEERCKRRMDRENDPALRGELAQPHGELLLHPEATLEVELAGRVRALDEELDRRLG